MTGVDDLATWLRAQLDDDERMATAAYPNVWHVEETKHGEFLIVPDHFPSTPAVARTEPNAEHIARWDPARVLAEVEAKRRVLDEHQIDRNSECETCRERGLERNQVWPCLTVRLLALPYADRPGYQEQWRPA